MLTPQSNWTLEDLKRWARDVTSIASRFSWGTAAPTTGTHRVGNIVFNEAPAIGAPMGWICTAAPCTWRPLANVL